VKPGVVSFSLQRLEMLEARKLCLALGILLRQVGLGTLRLGAPI